ncbi:MAG: YcxB family protein [Hyphomicrobium aestuarii]|nr:YcxB family protein [Hyphomicrobium aestuarii]
MLFERSFQCLFQEALAAQVIAGRTVLSFWERWLHAIVGFIFGLLAVMIIRLTDEIPSEIAYSFSICVRCLLVAASLALLAVTYQFVAVPLTNTWISRSINRRQPPITWVVKATDTGIAWRHSESAIELNWSGVERLVLTDDFLMLVHQMSLFYLPRRIFSDQDELRAFVDDALNRIQTDARQKSLEDGGLRRLRATKT